jgi:hypothetical protein
MNFSSRTSLIFSAETLPIPAISVSSSIIACFLYVGFLLGAADGMESKKGFTSSRLWEIVISGREDTMALPYEWVTSRVSRMATTP